MNAGNKAAAVDLTSKLRRILANCGPAATLEPLRSDIIAVCDAFDSFTSAASADEAEPVAYVVDTDGTLNKSIIRPSLPVGTQIFTRAAPAAQPARQSAFEAWAKKNGYRVERRNDPESPDTYFRHETEQRWIVWQAATTTSQPDEARDAALEEAARLCDKSCVQPAIAKMIRALKSAPTAASRSHPDPELQKDGWISVDERLPEGRYCLATYRDRAGKPRIIRAMYVRQYEIEATGDECDSETNEANDMEYIKAGWYECIDNWGEYSSVYVCEGPVTYWRPMPALPGSAPHPVQQQEQGK